MMKNFTTKDTKDTKNTKMERVHKVAAAATRWQSRTRANFGVRFLESAFPRGFLNPRQLNG